MRDSGKLGYLLPPSQIIPNAEEVFAGIATAVSKIGQILLMHCFSVHLNYILH